MSHISRNEIGNKTNKNVISGMRLVTQSVVSKHSFEFGNIICIGRIPLGVMPYLGMAIYQNSFFFLNVFPISNECFETNSLFLISVYRFQSTFCVPILFLCS